MKIAVIGSRAFFDKDLLYNSLDPLKDKIELIISGGAIGADSLAQEYAKDRGLPVLVIYPKWYKDGSFDKGAGFKRNIDIIKASTHVVAFWDGHSNGTRHSLTIAKKEGKPTKLVKFTSPIEGYHFINDDHPLSWSALRDIKYNDIVFKSVKHGYGYFVSLPENRADVLSLDLTKKRDSDKLDKIISSVKDEDRKSLNKFLYELIGLSLDQHSQWANFLSKIEGTIVFANPDRYFGIGMNKSDSNITSIELWGKNILGKCINKIKDV